MTDPLLFAERSVLAGPYDPGQLGFVATIANGNPPAARFLIPRWWAGPFSGRF
jgi:hypothetical protein